MQSKTQLFKSTQTTDIKVNVVIACKGANTKLNFRESILGVPMCEWVGKAFENYNVQYVDDTLDYIQLSKQYGTGYNYTVLILGNMPLLTNRDAQNLVQYAVFKQSNLVKFTGGYVVNNAYIASTDNPQVDSIYTLDMERFYMVENKRQLHQVLKVLKENIVNYHIAGGVEIHGDVEIEPTVEIESGATIFGGNVLKGYTYISRGAILKENNVIQDSFLDTDCCVMCSVLTHARVGKNSIVMPFCNINGKQIEDNVTIKSNTTIE